MQQEDAILAHGSGTKDDRMDKVKAITLSYTSKPPPSFYSIARTCISMHLLLWMKTMLDFIYTGIAEP